MADGGDSRRSDDELNAVNIRLLELEQRVDELAEQLGNLVEQPARQSHPPTPDDVQPPAADEQPDRQTTAEAAAPAPAISPVMLRIIQHIQRGDGETAQQELRALPPQELASQPAVVTLVAAALFVQQGNIEAGLKTLKRARALTDDSRLLRLITLLEQQSA